MDRHPDTARSSESERRVGARTEASFAATSFDNVAGKGLKSVFFFLRRDFFLPPLISLPVKARIFLAHLRRLLRESQRRARGRGKETKKGLKKKKVSENLALWQQRAWEPGSHPGKRLCVYFQLSHRARAPVEPLLVARPTETDFQERLFKHTPRTRTAPAAAMSPDLSPCPL